MTGIFTDVDAFMYIKEERKCDTRGKFSGGPFVLLVLRKTSFLYAMLGFLEILLSNSSLISLLRTIHSPCYFLIEMEKEQRKVK